MVMRDWPNASYFWINSAEKRGSLVSIRMGCVPETPASLMAFEHVPAAIASPLLNEVSHIDRNCWR